MPRYMYLYSVANCERGGLAALMKPFATMPVKYSFLLVLVMLASTVPNYQQDAFGASPTASGRTASGQRAAPVVKDVALGPDGLLRGQIMHAAVGNGENPVEIILYQNQQPIAQVACDAKGRFCSGPIPTGTYAIVVSSHLGTEPSMIVRIWAHGTAPPSAVESIVLSRDAHPIYRGQLDWPSLRSTLFRNRWATAVAIGAAIAIPIAVTYEKYSAS